MENREAIEWLKGCVVSYEVDNKGKPNGNVTCELIQEVIDMAISALEKQTPRAVRTQFDRRHNYFLHFCPVCGGLAREYEYCSECGQKLSYEEEEE